VKRKNKIESYKIIVNWYPVIYSSLTLQILYKFHIFTLNMQRFSFYWGVAIFFICRWNTDAGDFNNL
jgi:hypothetical protein